MHLPKRERYLLLWYFRGSCGTTYLATGFPDDTFGTGTGLENVGAGLFEALIESSKPIGSLGFRCLHSTSGRKFTSLSGFRHS